jgi:hypothetical protein
MKQLLGRAEGMKTDAALEEELLAFAEHWKRTDIASQLRRFLASDANDKSGETAEL